MNKFCSALVSILRSLNRGQPLPFKLRLKRWKVLASGLTIGLFLLPAIPVVKWSHPSSIIWVESTAVAQRIRVEDIRQQVYQQLPELPLENTYVNQETGDVSTENTLVSRLMRYHIYIKGRSTSYRFDWKLTLADYLGANERMDAETYPSATSLKTNPIQGDIAAVRSLDRSQRDALVNVLVSLFNPQANQSQPSASPSPLPVVSPTPSPSPAPVVNPRFPRQPQPGDANLLLP